MTSGYTLSIEYPPNAVNAPRWGWEEPVHPRLAARMADGHDQYAVALRGILDYADDLRTIPAEPGDDAREPAWCNGFIPGVDGAALYAFVRARRPARYLEVGSGNSTKFVARAKRDGALATEIVSFDPEPRAEIDELCDVVVRQPFELADHTLFEGLRPGDVVFFDGTHRVFMNNDAVAFFVDVLPEIPEGVLVGIHDIFLPDDYPQTWSERWYAEQYLLAAWLLGGGGGFEIRLPAFYASVRTPLGGVLAPLWDTPGLEAVERHGGAFWIERPLSARGRGRGRGWRSRWRTDSRSGP